jgi:glutamine amidotransferase
VREAVIVDAGGTNFTSLEFALERLGVRSTVTQEAHVIAGASHVILPGVGSAAHAMCRLRETGLAAVITSLTQPVLGVCLGMQLLFSRSEEGDTGCLGLFPETIRKLKPGPGRPVPHMGWNQLEGRQDDPLLDGIQPRDYVYFVHSYAAPVSDFTLASTDYGGPLSAVVRRGNFCGTQFHPERSGPTGARLLENFLRI